MLTAFVIWFLIGFQTMGNHQVIVPPLSAFRHETHRAAAGFTCKSRVQYVYEGEIFDRACGRCKHCIARDLQDATGRAAAEAAVSEEVSFWTLTYAPGHLGASQFVTPDRQKFMYRVRSSLRADARRRLGYPKRKPRSMPDEEWSEMKARLSAETPRVKFTGAGERGSRNTRRCHWHLLIFSPKKTGWVSTERDDRGKYVRETHPLWKLGFATVEVYTRDEFLSVIDKVRYCTKYIRKARLVSRRERLRGVPEQAKFFQSLRPALGRDLLEDQARAIARNGLSLTGCYSVGGVTNSINRTNMAAMSSRARSRAPKNSRFFLQGAMRLHYIKAYRDEWEKLRPDTPVPYSDWMRANDPDWIDGEPGRVMPINRAFDKHKWKSYPKDAKPPLRELPPNKPVKRGMLAVMSPDRKTVGMVRMDKDGFASYWPVKGDAFAIGPDGLASAHDVAVADKEFAAKWISDRRGPDWVSPADRRLHDRALAAQRRAAIERFAKDGPELRGLQLPGHKVTALTGLRRQFAMKGDSYQAGQVVRDGPRGPEFQVPGGRRPKPIHKYRP